LLTQSLMLRYFIFSIGFGIASDKKGNNVYLTGGWHPGAQIGNYSFDTWGMFIAKVDPESGEFTWFSYDDSNRQDGQKKGRVIICDDNGSVFAAGDYRGNITFDHITLPGELMMKWERPGWFILRITYLILL
jgi:hypothetical protein